MGVFFFFFFSFVQTKNWDNKIIYKVIFSLGLTLPSYTHNIPNLSPQVFSQVGASKFSFYFQRIEKLSFYQVLKLWIPILTFCPCANTLNHKDWEGKHSDPS